MKKRALAGFFLLVFCLSLTGMKQGAFAAGKSRYQIRVNKQQNVVNIYRQDKKGRFKPYRAFVCSTGAATPLGRFSLGAKYRWHQLMGPSYGQYCSRIYKGILFHSVWYYKVAKNTQSYVQYNRLGSTASHGCIRLTVSASKWIYENCPSGTPVFIYNASNPGPFGKPKARKMSGYMGWDPTDPDPNNPYFVKLKSFRVSASKKTLTLGAGKAEAKLRLKATAFHPKKATVKTIRYRSSNPRIATVSQDGVVRAKRQGACTMVAETTDGSKLQRKCKIRVKKKPPEPIPAPTAEPSAEPTQEPTTDAEPTDAGPTDGAQAS